MSALNFGASSPTKWALPANGLRLSMPVFAIGSGWTDAFGRAREVEASMRFVATDVPGQQQQPWYLCNAYYISAL